MRQAFHYFNASRSGYISYPEFELALEILFPNILSDYAQKTNQEMVPLK
jgi:hypothetical protein